MLHGHSEGELWGLAVSQQSHDFATASCDKTVCTWSLDTKVRSPHINSCTCISLSLFFYQTCLNVRQLDQEAASTDISPDGELLAVGLHNGEFLILKFADLSQLVAQKRDRSKVLQVVK